MGDFIADEVDRIDLGDGKWADIKHRMSYGDEQKITGHFIRIASMRKALASGKPGDVDVSIDLESGNILALLINIKAWNLTDDDGNIAPITEENIIRLPREYGNKLKEEINQRNPLPKA